MAKWYKGSRVSKHTKTEGDRVTKEQCNLLVRIGRNIQQTEFKNRQNRIKIYRTIKRMIKSNNNGKIQSK